MSFIHSLVISLLCLIFLTTSSSARHIGVINKLPQNTTFQDPAKLHSPEKLETEKSDKRTSSQANATLVHNERKMLQEERKMKANSQEFRVNDKGRRGDDNVDELARVIPAYTEESKGIKSKFTKSMNSWRVPRKRKGVPQTGFNLDYAPPKVHPPVHN